MKIPVVVQHRHVHLSEPHAKALFGENWNAQEHPIDQRGQFVSPYTVEVIGPNGSFAEVAVLGPCRSSTQVELSSSDAFAIGVKAPLRVSGDTDRSATVTLKAGENTVKASMSAIVPIRHLHLPPSVADDHNLAHHDVVTVSLVHRPNIQFEHVLVRVHPTFTPAFHLTKDEAAPHWVQTGDEITL